MSIESRIAKQNAGPGAATAPADPKPEAAGRSGVQSVEIAGVILRALAARGGVSALGDLAASCGMGRAKVHRYLLSLKRAGLVGQDSRSGHYRIGPSAITIGLVGLGSLNPLRQVYEALPTLRDRAGETVTMAIWGEMGPTIVAMEEAGRTVTMNVRVGSVLPLLSSAIGRVFAAFLPDSVVRERLAAEERRAVTGGPLLSPTEVSELLAGVRSRRMARIEGGLLQGVDAFAAPVFDYRGKTVAVVCVLGRSEELDRRWSGKPAQALAETTDEISRALGFVALTPAVR